MDSANSRLSSQNNDLSSRPDWDPYAVWLTHIMKTQDTASKAAEVSKNDTNPAASNDGSWSPYSVWQALIKN